MYGHASGQCKEGEGKKAGMHRVSVPTPGLALAAALAVLPALCQVPPCRAPLQQEKHPSQLEQEPTLSRWFARRWCAQLHPEDLLPATQESGCMLLQLHDIMSNKGTPP